MSAPASRSPLPVLSHVDQRRSTRGRWTRDRDERLAGVVGAIVSRCGPRPEHAPLAMIPSSSLEVHPTARRRRCRRPASSRPAGDREGAATTGIHASGGVTPGRTTRARSPEIRVMVSVHARPPTSAPRSIGPCTPDSPPAGGHAALTIERRLIPRRSKMRPGSTLNRTVHARARGRAGTLARIPEAQTRPRAAGEASVHAPRAVAPAGPGAIGRRACTLEARVHTPGFMSVPARAGGPWRAESRVPRRAHPPE